MEGPAEPDDQLTADNRPAAAAPIPRIPGRAVLVLCALAAVAVYAAGTLLLLAALLALARRRAAGRPREPGR